MGNSLGGQVVNPDTRSQVLALTAAGGCRAGGCTELRQAATPGRRANFPIKTLIKSILAPPSFSFCTASYNKTLLNRQPRALPHDEVVFALAQSKAQPIAGRPRLTVVPICRKTRESVQVKFYGQQLSLLSTERRSMSSGGLYVVLIWP